MNLTENEIIDIRRSRAEILALQQAINNLGKLLPYTPLWTADITSPAIGDGLVSGWYGMTGRLITVAFLILPGATTTFGSGTYRLSYPPGLLPKNDYFVGHWWLYDAGAAVYPDGAIYTSPTGMSFAGGGTTFWTATTPITFANGDALRGTLVYGIN